MAGNQDSGRTPTFAVSDAKLEEHIAKYKQDCDDGIICRPSWLHFAASLDCTADDLRAVMAKEGMAESAYRKRATMLKKMRAWIMGQVSSGSYGWIDAPSPLIKAELETDWGDGVSVGNKGKDPGPQVVQVMFGGGDPRSHRAAE